LPAQLTSFVGRERDIAEITRTLANRRLLTLTGTGGVGKSRLALEVGARQPDYYPDGVWLIELASLTAPDLVAEAVAGTLGLRQMAGRPGVDNLADQLQSKHALLVLDNCEQVVQGCAQLADRLLQLCPRVWILATSRRPLGVAGETSWRVPSLRVPDPRQMWGTDELAGIEAVQLFVERARLVRPSFVLEERDAAALADICRHLDGIPLAIELAAARINVLSVEQIAERMQDRFRLLIGAHRTGSARQRTLRATVDWSYGLLSSTEQVFFNRLSVFAGGWTLEAAEAVCSGDGIATEDVLELVARLVEQSLVLADEEVGRERRYGLLETLRQYAREKLEASGEADSIGERHRNWYISFGQEAERNLSGPRQGDYFEQLAREHDNLRAALAHCLATDPVQGLALAANLTWFWLLRGHVPEGQEWLESLLERADGSTISAAGAASRAAALVAAGYLAIWLDDHETASARLEEGLALAREIGDARSQVEAVCSLAIAAHQRGEDPGDLLEKCLSGWRMGGAHPSPCYINLSDLAELVRGRGDPSRAVALNEESVESARKRGDSHAVAYALRCQGHLAWQAGEQQRARDLHKQSLAMAWQLTDRLCSARCLEELALVASAQRQAERAAKLFGAASAWWGAMGVRLQRIDRVDHDRGVQTARDLLSDDMFKAAWSHGAILSAQQAVDFGLSDFETGPAPRHAASGAEPLTFREQEVVVLVARGLTNHEIAERLVITQRTAEAHVTHILAKLELRSRAQIALWAAQHGLVLPGPA
jgi:non-specific serine/threonine protein kinase